MISTKEYWKKMSEGPMDDRIANITLALSQCREVMLECTIESLRRTNKELAEKLKELTEKLKEYEQKVAIDKD